MSYYFCIPAPQGEHTYLVFELPQADVFPVDAQSVAKELIDLSQGVLATERGGVGQISGRSPWLGSKQACGI